MSSRTPLVRARRSEEELAVVEFGLAMREDAVHLYLRSHFAHCITYYRSRVNDICSCPVASESVCMPQIYEGV